MNWRFGLLLISLLLAVLCNTKSRNSTDEKHHKTMQIILADADEKVGHQAHKGKDKKENLITNLTKTVHEIKNSKNEDETEQLKDGVNFLFAFI